MLQNLTGWHALIVLAVVFLLFGATKLPALAKSVGESVNILKKEVGESPSPVQPVSTVADSSVPGAPEHDNRDESTSTGSRAR